MFVQDFFSEANGKVMITAKQGSMFAKEIAGDFNPLHDHDYKRFCVPGDLLFSIVLAKYGLSKKMLFTFSGMLGHGGITLSFPVTSQNKFDIVASNNKTILKIERHGEKAYGQTMIDTLVCDYAAFSGRSFPCALVQLMAEHGVMFNPKRPLVIYHSMFMEFKHLNFSRIEVEMLEPKLDINKKRADAYLYFQVISDGQIVGTGFKKIVISGLLNYNEESMRIFVDNYLAKKNAHLESVNRLGKMQ